MSRFRVWLTVLLLAAPTAAFAHEGFVERTCQVVDLRDARNEIRFALDGTTLSPTAFGEARLEVAVKRAETPLRLTVKGLRPATQFGQEYLTYVAWRLEADGSARSLGELRTRGGEAALTAKVPRGPFGVIVTAEPHFAVTQPSNTVVLSGRPTVKSAKRVASNEVACRLLPRHHYELGRTQESMQLLFASEARTPSEMLQARNAIEIARLSDAETFAPDRLDEATRQLILANNLLLGKGERKQAAAAAIEAVASAEIARQIAVDRKRVEQQRLRDLEQARRQADESAALLQEAQRQAALDAQRRAELEQQLEEEKKRRAEAELRRERALEAWQAQDRAQPPAAVVEPERAELAAQLARIEQEREAARRENDQIRQELREERERLMRESRKEMEDSLELERARLQIALAEERSELKVERARLETERQLLEAQKAERAASEAAAPGAAEVADDPASEELAKAQAEWQALSGQITAEREALVAEREELRSLSDEVSRRLESERQMAEAAEASAETGAVAGAEPVEKGRRWWFGKKKAGGEPAATDDVLAATPAATPTAELEEERRRLTAEREKLAAERSELESERRELEAEQAERTPAKRRWWFGGSKDRSEPVVVEDPAVAAELSRLETERARLEDERRSERQRMDAELQMEREKLAAERARLEAEMKLREAERLREQPVVASAPARPDPEVDRLNQRVERLERELARAELDESSEQANQRQAALMEELAGLRKQVTELESAQATRAAAESVPAMQPAAATPPVAVTADVERLAMLLNAERSPRGLLLRLPDSFVTGHHELRPEARERLARVAGVLLGQPDVRVEIEGHTDSTGDPAVNQRLSELRALEVLNYLTQLGVSGASMTARGFGDTRPTAPNDTAEGRRQNRRVELIVSAQGGDPT